MIAILLAGMLSWTPAAPNAFVVEASPAAVSTDRAPVPSDAPGAALVSALAPRIGHGAADVPEGWLAQRSIDRSWGLSDDSLYTEVVVPGWKSEGLAFAMSAVLPGAGERYVGENSAWVFLAAEVLGWAGRTLSGRKADDRYEQNVALVGDPADSTAGWSFDRYRDAGGARVAELQTLWAVDRASFYRTLADDPAVEGGFVAGGASVFRDAYDEYQGLRRRSRLFEAALWVNHAVSAFDALRAAHLHNLSLRPDTQLQMGARLVRGRPALRAALTRRF